MNIFILWAHRTDYEHDFSEPFTSIEKVNQYLENHPECVKDRISLVELDPS